MDEAKAPVRPGSSQVPLAAQAVALHRDTLARRAGIVSCRLSLANRKVLLDRHIFEGQGSACVDCRSCPPNCSVLQSAGIRLEFGFD